MSANDSFNSNPSPSISNTSLSTPVIRNSIVRGELKISSKRGRSKVWEVFGKVENMSEEEIKDVVACRKCLNVYKYNGATTSNLVRHKCYLTSNNKNIKKVEVNAGTKQNGTLIFTEWIVENCRPFQLVEDTGFHKVAKFLLSVGANFGEHVDVRSLLPHSTTISRNIMNVYNKHFEKIKTDINSVKSVGFGLTSDLWTDNFIIRTYIAVTIHYIKDGHIFSRLLGINSMDGEKCTSNIYLLDNIYL